MCVCVCIYFLCICVYNTQLISSPSVGNAHRSQFAQHALYAYHLLDGTYKLKTSDGYLRATPLMKHIHGLGLNPVLTRKRRKSRQSFDHLCDALSSRFYEITASKYFKSCDAVAR